MLVWIPAAFADDPKALGQTPPALAWIRLQDSRGIPIWNYELSIDRGGITDPSKFYWAAVTDISWGIYRGWCAIALWFLDWVMSFGWIHTIAAPLLRIEGALQQVIGRLGLVPTLLALSALLAGILLLKGRFTTAIWEAGIICVIAALATTVFSHPVQMVAGDNGAVVYASRFGQEVAAGIATGDTNDKSPAQLRRDQSGQLVDTFIRQPTEMINFGRVIDGTKCEGAYNDVIKAGPYGFDDDIRNKVADCSSELGDYAANPSSGMAIGSIVVMPAAFVILLLALVLAGSVIVAAISAMFQSVKAIITLITGLLPGGSRGSLMLTIAEIVVALVLIGITSVFLSVFLLVIQALFAQHGGEDIPKTFVLVDVLLVVGTIVFLRWRRQILAASQRLAQWMARRPGEGPTQLPDRRTRRGAGAIAAGVTAAAVRTGIGLAQLRAQRAMAYGRQGGSAANEPASPTTDQSTQSSGPPDGPHPTGGPDRRPPSPPSPQPDGGSPTGNTGGGPDHPAAPRGGNSRRAEQRVQARRKRVRHTLARAGTHAVLAYVSGGTSAVASTARVARAALSARRAALLARMATTGTTPRQTPPTRPRPRPARGTAPETAPPVPPRASRTPEHQRPAAPSARPPATAATEPTSRPRRAAPAKRTAAPAKRTAAPPKRTADGRTARNRAAAGNDSRPTRQQKQA